MKWRWDQGRLDYFQLDEIRRIARALVAFNGQALPRSDDPDTLRTTLETYSDRPFLPDHYKVWRNYKRVFGCQMLATELNNIVVCTDICRQLANGSLSSDDYLIHVARHFYYPSPVFDDYQSTGRQVFSMCAVIKLLVSRFVEKGEPFVSIEKIVDLLKGNTVDGTESLNRYGQLRTTGTRISDGSDELRQIREMLRYLSQLSFLKWDNPNLWLDVATKASAIAVADLLTPSIAPRKSNTSEELLQLGGSAMQNMVPEFVAAESINPFDVEFTEGSRTRVVHLRMERSSKLKELYFSHVDDPYHCDMCEMDTRIRYPWTGHLIELHHLLPLASPIRVEKKTTSLNDIVGLCPSCHRATHKYYSRWLRDHDQRDFATYTEAKEVYGLAKSLVVL